MNYIVNYRYNRSEWNQIEVIGHRYDEKSDKMEFFKPNGGILALAEWSKYDIELNEDWAEMVKQQQENKENQK